MYNTTGGFQNKYCSYMRLTELYNVTDLQPIKWDDIGLSDSGGDACLWVGTEGSQTRLHYDAYGWNCVCYGL